MSCSGVDLVAAARANCGPASIPSATNNARPRIITLLPVRPSHNLSGRGVCGTLVIAPGDLQIVTLFADLEAELDKGVLGYCWFPEFKKHKQDTKNEQDQHDVMRRDKVSLGILDEAG